jgi:hypothetical protein
LQSTKILPLKAWLLVIARINLWLLDTVPEQAEVEWKKPKIIDFINIWNEKKRYLFPYYNFKVEIYQYLCIVING